MATVSPISPGAGDLRPILPVKPAVVTAHPEATSAGEDFVSLTPEAVQLIQAASLSAYEDQQVAEGATSAGENAGPTLELVG
jgi:hypothetical protein